MAYYFDVLPLHPPPEYLESLTSYLMRLAELNGISSIDGLSALCFPHQDRRITRYIADYPPVSFGELTRVETWSEDILRTTTFFHLAAKFGRATLPQPMSRFLSGCVGSHLRYCPLCLTEQQVRYYFLPWRFLSLTCCCKHKSQLLETCGHCGKLIPLFTAPFTLGNCPKCRVPLAQCATVSVSDETELKKVAQTHDDIVFFLTPQSWEKASASIVKHLGQRFAQLRRMSQLTAIELASQIGVTLTMVEGIERGNFQGKGATFLSYCKYAWCLGISFKEIFRNVLETPDHVTTIPLPFCPTCHQNNAITRFGYNRCGTQRYQCHSCHRSFTASPKAREVRRGFS